MPGCRQQTIDAYRAYCASPAFFDEGGWRDEWLHPSLRSALARGEEGVRALAKDGVRSYRGDLITARTRLPALEPLLARVGEAFNRHWGYLTRAGHDERAGHRRTAARRAPAALVYCPGP